MHHKRSGLGMFFPHSVTVSQQVLWVIIISSITAVTFIARFNSFTSFTVFTSFTSFISYEVLHILECTHVSMYRYTSSRKLYGRNLILPMCTFADECFAGLRVRDRGRHITFCLVHLTDTVTWLSFLCFCSFVFSYFASLYLLYFDQRSNNDEIICDGLICISNAVYIVAFVYMSRAWIWLNCYLFAVEGKDDEHEILLNLKSWKPSVRVFL